MNDLDVIKEIEKKLHGPFKKMDLVDLKYDRRWWVRAYSVDVSGNVTGLRPGNIAISLDEEISKFSSLELLFLKKGQFEKPESLTNLKKLNSLDLSKTKITDFSFLKELKGLTSLNLSKTGIADFSILKELKGLTSLDLSGSGITDFSALKELKGLTSFNLSATKITDFSILKELKGLTSLNLSATKITDFSILKELKGLTSLDLSGSGITDFSALKELKGLTSLNLSETEITDFSALKELKGLTSLNLSGTGITDFSPLEELKGLTSLFLSRTKITDISFLKELKGLTSLFLARTEIIDISVLKELKGLTSLNLSEAQNTDFSFLKELKSLTSLYLWAVQITDFSFLKELKGLISLDLWNTQITDISVLKELKSLTFLDLAETKVVDLSVVMDLPNLDGLEIGGIETLEEPPKEIAEKGLDEIRNYFRQLKKDGQDYLYEAKLLIVGEGEAGKTTLARKIETPDYELKDEDTTKGIDVISWDFQMENGQSFKVNMWDFGGQEIYHATHQFFLTKRSLYVLVADTRKEDTDFFYWLNTVEMLCKDSPLLIVKNEKQDRHREINEKQLRGQFDNLKETLAVNLANNRGLDEVVGKIKHYVTNLPHIGEALPKTWVRVREALEKEERDYVSVEEYFDICQEKGFTRREDKLQLSGYLHDLGVCLHFQEDPVLFKTVILSPKWGTDAVYKVLDNKEVVNNMGRFSKRDLDRIWDEKEYVDMHAELLQLMINFKLCYAIPDSEYYIAPQLLTANAPDYDWEAKENIILRYEYNVMPKGLITRFIVNMHDCIADQGHVWRSGVILEKDGTRAEVIEKYGARKIKVRISGANRKALMTIIMYQLDVINSSYKRMKYDKFIPCNCEVCKGSQAPYFYKFESLKKRLNNQQYEVECDNSYKKVNVLGLIDDIVLLERKEVKNEKYKEGMFGEVFDRDGMTLLVDARSFQSVNQTANQEQAVSQEQHTTISIEIKNHIEGLSKTFDNMKEDMLDEIEDEGEKKKLAKDLEKMDKAIEEVKQIKDKEAAKSSPALDRMKRFIDKLGDASTRAGKAVKAMEDGVGYAQDLAKNYNKIAEWCGIPVVPSAFLKK